jgi:transcriptional regulator with XRE-family HTH domain
VEDDFSDDKPVLDMFGNVVKPIRDRRGRPTYKKDKENQDFVAARIARGWTQKAIAADMGVDEKTLRKYFSRELENGRIFVEGMILDVLIKLAREGKPAAIKQLREMMVEAGPQAPRSRRGLEDDNDDDVQKPVVLGKKDQRIHDAQNIPDEYGDIFDRMQKRAH